jgi:hypothetical protein
MQQQQMLAMQQQMQAGVPLRTVLPGQVRPTAVAGLGLDSLGTKIDFADLELRRVIGTGQFGLVRVVRHVKTDEVFALKVRLSLASLDSSYVVSCDVSCCCRSALLTQLLCQPVLLASMLLALAQSCLLCVSLNSEWPAVHLLAPRMPYSAAQATHILTETDARTFAS